ncbi:DUF4862 family protein [Martelella alba]|uniref:DUF4862 family protein n=1 Tax=Martelella alba TaxID=2590451 RepID=A0ABY2SFK4_9HYPH|nr:DUF4862 family protein [Martelella alba]TKI02829.1 DUF4862 family protein [Martelella alba]
MTNNDFIVGAYPCAPSFHQLAKRDEIEFWRALAELPAIRGIEQPCLDELHPYGSAFLFEQIPAHWQVVVTAVMGTMQRRGAGRDFGLAARNEGERLAAIEHIRHIRDEIKRANDLSGRQRVLALEIQSAPNQGEQDAGPAAACFIDSLEQILSWQWECPLIIEHCDALTGPAPRKGFLPLADEINAATVLNQRFGRLTKIAVNWGRSAIEGHHRQLPLTHIRQCRLVGLLGAVMFSGTATGGPYGQWEDNHAPFAPFAGGCYRCEDSLMTLDDARDAFALAPLDSLDYAGIKLLSTSAHESVNKRVDIIKDGIQALLLSSANASISEDNEA